jgi:ABC-type branched-subunit amino acid transport system ATPase component
MPAAALMIDAGAGTTDLATVKSVLSINHVSVRFGGVAALIDVTLEVQAREVLAVVGPNGAGKTTLLNAICGMTRGGVSGQISLLGRPISRLSALQVAQSGVGRSFQHPALIDRESVVENVMSGVHIQLGYGFDQQFWRRGLVRERERQMRERALQLLSLAGIADLARATVADLPYGTRKLIDVARALISSPKLLLLDEPTSGLDTGEQQLVAKLLSRVRAEMPVTMLLVEHHMDFVRSVADSVAGLQAGKILARGTPTEVFSSDAFRAALVGSQGTAAETRLEKSPESSGS